MDQILEQINSNKNKIKQCEYDISLCVQENKQLKVVLIEKCNEMGHQWIVEREDCLYGETYRYCKICGKDRVYDYTHF